MLLNVRLSALPDKEAPQLTRFQSTCPPHLAGRTLLGVDAQPSDTVRALKARVAEARPATALCGEAPEMLRKGGSGGKGVVLLDDQTLADCGITQSMGVFEYLWVDSADNQRRFAKEYEKVLSYVDTQRDFLDTKAD